MNSKNFTKQCKYFYGFHFFTETLFKKIENFKLLRNDVNIFVISGLIENSLKNLEWISRISGNGLIRKKLLCACHEYFYKHVVDSW